MNKSSKIELTIIFDNISYSKQLQTKWGYSCLIKTTTDTILFDTGSDGKILLDNMSKLNIDPKLITSVIISHNHWDHLDGLTDFLQINPNVTVYIPESSDEHIETGIIHTGAEIVRIKSVAKITDGIYSLGELQGRMPEQSIAIKTSKGMIVLTGCAHHGIINIIKKAQTTFPNEPVYLAMGGFHLKDDSKEGIKQTVKTIYDLNVDKVAPSHCTGEDAIREFENIYQNNYLKSGIGKKITIEKDE